jgi:hypothetical protein
MSIGAGGATGFFKQLAMAITRNDVEKHPVGFCR